MPMKPTAVRPFTLADAAIGIAGLAVGLALVRLLEWAITPGDVWAALAQPRAGWSIREWLGWGIELEIELGLGWVAPVLAGWTPACLLLQCRAPRPRWRRLRRAPGFVAGLLASGIVVGSLAVAGGLLALGVLGPKVGLSWDRFLAVIAPLLIGSSILASWTTLKLGGIWWPRPTWTDRLGRLTGAAWVALGAVSGAFFAAEVL